MKKILVLILTLVMVLGFAGCGQQYTYKTIGDLLPANFPRDASNALNEEVEKNFMISFIKDNALVFTPQDYPDDPSFSFDLTRSVFSIDDGKTYELTVKNTNELNLVFHMDGENLSWYQCYQAINNPDQNYIFNLPK